MDSALHNSLVSAVLMGCSHCICYLYVSGCYYVIRQGLLRSTVLAGKVKTAPGKGHNYNTEKRIKECQYAIPSINNSSRKVRNFL